MTTHRTLWIACIALALLALGLAACTEDSGSSSGRAPESSHTPAPTLPAASPQAPDALYPTVVGQVYATLTASAAILEREADPGPPAASPPAPDDSALTGWLVDGDGQALSGTTMLFLFRDDGDGVFEGIDAPPPTDALVNATTTGLDGSFSFGPLAPGTYWLQADPNSLPEAFQGRDPSALVVAINAPLADPVVFRLE